MQRDKKDGSGSLSDSCRGTILALIGGGNEFQWGGIKELIVRGENSADVSLDGKVIGAEKKKKLQTVLVTSCRTAGGGLKENNTFVWKARGITKIRIKRTTSALVPTKKRKKAESVVISGGKSPLKNRQQGNGQGRGKRLIQ